MRSAASLNLHRLHVEGDSAQVSHSGNGSRGNSKGLLSAHPSSWTLLHVLLIAAHCLGLTCSLFVFAWVLRFRGGLPLIAHDSSVADPSDLVFNVHPVLMIAGFIVVASEGILVFRGVNGTQNYKKGIHLTVQGFALLMGIIGTWAAFRFHNAKGIDNLYSLHSWIGIITIVLFGIQWISGFITYWYPGAPGKIRASLLPWHVFMGIFIYCLALISAETGFLEKLTFLMVNKKIGKFSLEATFVNSTALILIVYGVIVIMAPVLTKNLRHDLGRNQD